MGSLWNYSCNFKPKHQINIMIRKIPNSMEVKTSKPMGNHHMSPLSFDQSSTKATSWWMNGEIHNVCLIFALLSIVFQMDHDLKLSDRFLYYNKAQCLWLAIPYLLSCEYILCVEVCIVCCMYVCVCVVNGSLNV